VGGNGIHTTTDAVGCLSVESKAYRTMRAMWTTTKDIAPSSMRVVLVAPRRRDPPFTLGSYDDVLEEDPTQSLEGSRESNAPWVCSIRPTRRFRQNGLAFDIQERTAIETWVA